MISKIWSSTLSDYISSDKIENKDYLNLRRMNLIIGANNTGKSRLLRKLFLSTENELSVLNKELSNTVKAVIQPILDVVPSDKKTPQITGREIHELARGKLEAIPATREKSEKLIKLISEALNKSLNYNGGEETTYFYHVRNALRKITEDEFKSKIKSIQSDIKIPNRHYIPILRGMRPLNSEKDLFTERTIKDYFPNKKSEDINIVTGFKLYELLAEFLLGQPEEREQVRAYEKIIGTEFFGGADITLIPEYKRDTVSVKIGNDKQFPIYDLGDGLQQVIIITSTAFLQKEKSIYFIEEPEICLHPGLLRKLATFLLNHTTHQYILTTHSNHLLDLAENESTVLIHRLTKESGKAHNTFKINECTKDREILSDLGVHASSVYLSNSTIWIEGITDRLYLKIFMKKYLESLPSTPENRILQGYLENHHYTFIEYQGGTLGHWNFDDDSDLDLSATRLCAEALLIVDGDIANKGDRLPNLIEQLGERVYVLKGKEIENLIPEEIMKEAALKLFENKRLPKDDLEKSKLTSISYTTYARSSKGIGYHLDRIIGLKGSGKNNRRFFADESGTIKDKVKFCNTCIDIMNRISWNLTPEISEICSRIFLHIKNNNKN